MEQLFNELVVPRPLLEDRVRVALDGIGMVVRLGHVLVIMQKPTIMLNQEVAGRLWKRVTKVHGRPRA